MIMAAKTAQKGAKKSVVRFKRNAQGKKIEAVLPIRLYEKLIEQAEELEDIRACDKAMKNPDFIPLEEVKKQLGL
jgi:hypothetical protein